MTWPPTGTKVLTQVWCLHGSKAGTLSIFSPDGNSASVVIDLVAAKATRDALNEAIRRMEAAIDKAAAVPSHNPSHLPRADA